MKSFRQIGFATRPHDGLTCGDVAHRLYTLRMHTRATVPIYTFAHTCTHRSHVLRHLTKQELASTNWYATLIGTLH